MSEPTPQNQDAQHLQILSVFHYVCAGILALFACFPIFHLVMGFVMVFSPQLFGPSKDTPPTFIGWFFVIFSGMFILTGWTLAALLAWAGRCLGRRKHHMFCLVMAGLACAFMPFGTVLGVFTILVLMRPSVKSLFNQTVTK